MRKEIEKIFNSTGDTAFLSRLIAICCHFCRQQEHNDFMNKDIDKSLKLIVFPIFNALSRDNNTILKSIGCMLLNETANLFPDVLDTDSAIKKRLSKAIDQSISTKDNKYIIESLKTISPRSYANIINNLLYHDKHDMAFAVSMCFIAGNVHFYGHGFRFQPTFRNESDPFVDVGVSLDEGITEWLTLRICDVLETSDAYFFEVRFMEKMIKKFEIQDENELIKAYFQGEGIEFIYNITKKLDECFFYNFIFTTDRREWKKAVQMLNEIGKE